MPTRTAAEVHALKCELAGEVLRSSGQLRLRVTGWSMLPTIFPGDTLIIESTNSDCIHKGDIVLFRHDRRLFAHRVSGKTGGNRDLRVVTQGDGMRRPDPPISNSQLLGKISGIVRDGRLVGPAQTLGISKRGVAALVRRSSTAARVVVGVHNLRRSSRDLNSKHFGLQECDPCPR